MELITKEAVKLEPCPLCGREVIITGGPEEWYPTWWDPDSGEEPYRIACECGCGLDMGYCELDELVEAWNRRIS